MIPVVHGDILYICYTVSPRNTYAWCCPRCRSDVLVQCVTPRGAVCATPHRERRALTGREATDGRAEAHRIPPRQSRGS